MANQSHILCEAWNGGIYINYLVHMTKMAAMPYAMHMVKTLQKSSSPNLVDRFQRNLA